VAVEVEARAVATKVVGLVAAMGEEGLAAAMAAVERVAVTGGEEKEVDLVEAAVEATVESTVEAKVEATVEVATVEVRCTYRCCSCRRI